MSEIKKHWITAYVLYSLEEMKELIHGSWQLLTGVVEKHWYHPVTQNLTPPSVFSQETCYFYVVQNQYPILLL